MLLETVSDPVVSGSVAGGIVSIALTTMRMIERRAGSRRSMDGRRIDAALASLDASVQALRNDLNAGVRELAAHIDGKW